MGLDLVAVQARFIAHVVVGAFVERGLASGNVFAPERVARHVVGSLQKLVYGIAEQCGVVAVRVQLDWDSAPPPYFNSARESRRSRREGCHILYHPETCV